MPLTTELCDESPQPMCAWQKGQGWRYLNATAERLFSESIHKLQLLELLLDELTEEKQSRTIEMEILEDIYQFTAIRYNSHLSFLYGIEISARKQLERSLNESLMLDDETRLPNKMMFSEHVGMKNVLGIHDGERYALIVLKIVDTHLLHAVFNKAEVRSWYGHFVDKLNQLTPLDGVLARLSEYEFGILLKDDFDDDSAMGQWLKHMLFEINQPFAIGDTKARLKIHAGITFLPNESATEKMLIQQARLAADEAENNGFDYSLYQLDMRSKLLKTHDLVNEFFDALENDQLFVTYQPQLDLNDEVIYSAEALVRWDNPARGLISPSVFIPIIESSGQIHKLTDWLLNKVCEDIAEINKNPDIKGLFSVSINLSIHSFLSPFLPKQLNKALSKHNIEPKQIECEVTETAAATEFQHVIKQMENLVDSGFSLALDDFGTGYSSLSYLRQMPVNKIKIDREFLQEDDAGSGKNLIPGIIDLGHSLDMKVVVEGVEKHSQREYLKMHGCDIIQGYLISKPIRIEQLKAILKT